VLKFPLTLALALCTLLALPGRAQAPQSRPPLIPEPREFEGRADLPLAHGFRVIAAHRQREDSFAADDLIATLSERGVKSPAGALATRIYLLRDSDPTAARLLRTEHASLDGPAAPEGYLLVTSGHDVYVIGHTAAGVFYGAQTLKQLITVSAGKATLHGCKIRDWPEMKYRGVSDDLSRGPVPTLEFQKQQIRTFAAYKINVYSPYFENTMQYASNPLPALPGGSITPAEARELVKYAQQYHITIIPEQEAFGHLHQVLTWEQYAQLAETPNGSVLAPGQPGSLQLINQWFHELASIYPSPFLHIGADETFELGRGQTANEVNQRGLGAVYIDFLTRIHQNLAPLNRRLLFWGDIAMQSPDLVPQLPKDMVAVAWEYSPHPEGFKKWLDPYTKAGMETWVASGVNNWNRVYPNFDWGLRNIQGFVADGHAAHSTGLLNTVWNDDGEGLFLEDWYGILFGAAAGWQPGSADIHQFQQAYGPVFHGDQTDNINQAQIALIDAQKTLLGSGLEDARDAYFWLDPWSPEGRQVDAKLQPVAPQVRLDAERAITLIAQARDTAPLREQPALDAMDLGARRIDFLVFKFQTADQIADAYRKLSQAQSDPEASKHISRDLWNLSGVNGRCQDLRDGYSYLRLRYRDVWLDENRPYYLDNIMAQYDRATQLWIGRAEKFRAARQQWADHHTLPTPEEIGIPAQ
jgi:hexosaminidase